MFAERANLCNAHNRGCDHRAVRVTPPGLRRSGAVATLLVEGRPVVCSPGDSVAAALVAAGVLACRWTGAGEPRGVFCGMGVCQECVLLVDGAPARACMTPVRDGLAVEPLRSGALPPPPPAELEAAGLEPDVLVVGGGPAGLAAAAAAAAAGARVVVADERPKLGGQYYKQPSEAFEADGRALDRQYRRGRALIARAERAGATLLAGVQVWAAAGPGELHALGPGVRYVLRPRRLVLAAGAYERGVPLPGWTLPGFFTTGAAQTLLRAYGVLPGRRVLVAGNGPLNAQVAAELARAGATVVALCELARAATPARAGALARMAASAPGLALEGAQLLARLRRARVPVRFGHTVVRAEGDGRVERAVVARVDGAGRPLPGSERAFEVDAVCAGFGFLPSNELARTLGVEHAFDPALGQLAAVTDARGRTAVDGVWVVGDGARTGGARLAEAAGTLAGLDAARSLGLAAPRPAGERRAARAAARARRFQRALLELYAAPRLLDQLAEPGTLVCRCEEVPLAAVEAALDEGALAIGAVKRLTRAGMGRCQGRYCAGVLAELSARRSGRPLDEEAWFAPAPPFKPLPVALAAAAAAPGGRGAPA